MNKALKGMGLNLSSNGAVEQGVKLTLGAALQKSLLGDKPKNQHLPKPESLKNKGKILPGDIMLRIKIEKFRQIGKIWETKTDGMPLPEFCVLMT